jgi:hypothetical protein
MRRLLVFWALAAAVLPGVAPRGHAAEAPEVSEEDKVLNRFLGTWRSTYKIHKAQLTPMEGKGSADLTFTRVLSNKFLHERRVHSDKSTHLIMYNYDPERKNYLAWWFASTGQAAILKGKWDADTKTMTWTSGEEAIRSTARYQFTNDDTIEWVLTIKEKDRVLLHMEGKNTRNRAFR